MSAPAAAQSVSDVAVTDATDTADRPASRTLAQVGRWARRVPFTIGVVALILVLGLVGEGWWRRVDRASWFPDIAYGLPPLREAKVWTPITGMPFGLTPAHYVTMTIAFAVLVGWAEWRLGTVRTAAVAVGGQVVGVLGAAAFLAISTRPTGTGPTGLPTSVTSGSPPRSSPRSRRRRRRWLALAVAGARDPDRLRRDRVPVRGHARRRATPRRVRGRAARRRTLVQPRRARALRHAPGKRSGCSRSSGCCSSASSRSPCGYSPATVRSGPPTPSTTGPTPAGARSSTSSSSRWWRCSCGAAGAGRGG